MMAAAIVTATELCCVRKVGKQKADKTTAMSNVLQATGFHALQFGTEIGLTEIGLTFV